MSGIVAGNPNSGGYAKYAMSRPANKDVHVTLTQTNGCLPVPGDKAAPGLLGFAAWLADGPHRSTQSGQCSSQLTVGGAGTTATIEIYNYSNQIANYTLSADDPTVKFQAIPGTSIGPTVTDEDPDPCPNCGPPKTPNPFFITGNVGAGSSSFGMCILSSHPSSVLVRATDPGGYTYSGVLTNNIFSLGKSLTVGFDDPGVYTVQVVDPTPAGSLVWSCDSDGGASNTITIVVPSNQSVNIPGLIFGYQ